MRQGIRAQGESPPDRLVAACQHALARHRSFARWRISRGRQGRRGQRPGAVAAGVPARFDDAGRASRDLGRRTDPDGAPGRIVRHDPPLRHHLVHGSDPQISASPERGAGRVVLLAIVRPRLAPVLPGGHRQGVGPPWPEYARRAGHWPAGNLDFRDRPRYPADLSVRSHGQPHRRRAGRASVPPPAGSADGLFPGAACRRFRWRGCAN